MNSRSLVTIQIGGEDQRHWEFEGQMNSVAGMRAARACYWRVGTELLLAERPPQASGHLEIFRKTAAETGRKIPSVSA